MHHHGFFLFQSTYTYKMHQDNQMAALNKRLISIHIYIQDASLYCYSWWSDTPNFNPHIHTRCIPSCVRCTIISLSFQFTYTYKMHQQICIRLFYFHCAFLYVSGYKSDICFQIIRILLY